MLSVLTFLGPAGSVFAQETWTEVVGPNFIVAGNVGGERVMTAAVQLEATRRLFQTVLPNARFNSAKPVVVLLLDEASMTRLMIEPGVLEETAGIRGGAFRESLDRFHLVARADGSADGQEASNTALRHEYLHLLMALNSGELPSWLREGLATFWQGVWYEAGETHIGVPDHLYVHALRRQPFLPINELLAFGVNAQSFESHQQATMFHAQSWGLLHYLLLEDSHGFRRDFEQFLDSIDQGEDPTSAFDAHLGSSNWELRLREHAAQENFEALVLTSVDSESARFEERQLSPADVALHSASFLLGGAALGKASSLIDEALEQDPDDAFANHLSGTRHLIKGEPKSAIAAFERAQRLGFSNFFSHFTLGLLEQSDSLAVERLRESVILNPEFSDSHAELALRLMSDAGTPPQEILGYAKTAVSLEPGDSRLWTILSAALTRAGLSSDSMLAARRALALAKTEKEKEVAQAILSEEEASPAAAPQQAATSDTRRLNARLGLEQRYALRSLLPDRAMKMKNWRVSNLLTVVHEATSRAQRSLTARGLFVNLRCAKDGELGFGIDIDGKILELNAESATALYVMKDGQMAENKDLICGSQRGDEVVVKYVPHLSDEGLGTLLTIEFLGTR